MGLSREDALEYLELPVGADQDSIRTSYKRLALKWHPEKHANSPEALTKFKLISRSYKKLTTSQSADDMSVEQMLQLFKDVFLSRQINSYNVSGSESSSSDDDDEEDYNDVDIEQEVRNSNLFPDKIKLKQDLKKSKEESNIDEKSLSPEKISQNANELITEEEKEKKKAKRRQAKKKRRQERKKVLKQNTDKSETTEDKKSVKQKTKDMVDAVTEHNEKDSKSSTSSDEAGFDQTSAFFTKVVNKKKKSDEALVIKARKEKIKKGDEDGDELDPKTLRSRQLAIKGNEMAHQEHYNAAIELFSEAIKLDPKDFRFFGNRSYCYDRLQLYEKALKDAEKAIQLTKDWPKGYFRQGRALAGLKMFTDAEVAFAQVLKLDKNCEDAVQELLRVRTHQIMEMGFTMRQAQAAIKKYGTVQAALDSLLAGVVAENLTTDMEVFISDDEDEFTASSNFPQLRTALSSDTKKMDPRNPEGLTALWVGNVLPVVTDKKLQQLFSRFGQVKSVRCLPEKFCAFVNFSTKEAAGKAMVALQGIECGGQHLLIKFPDHPVANGNDQPGTITLKKNQLMASKSYGPTPIATAVKPNIKVTGPVNGNECYFWRTTGCMYGDNCRNMHVPSHKGIDKKPWQHDQLSL